MSLSDKRYEGKEIVPETFEGLYPEKNVKEFIKKLKEEMFMLNPDHFEAIDELNKKNFDKIDKLAGDKTTENST